MFVNIFFTSFSPYDIQNYVWNFSFPQTTVCLLSATQIPHKICTALSKKMSGLQELLKTWKECISLPISSLHNPAQPHLFATSKPNMWNTLLISTQQFTHFHIAINKYPKPQNSTHTFPQPSTFLYITHLLLYCHYQKSFSLSNS